VRLLDDVGVRDYVIYLDPTNRHALRGAEAHRAHSSDQLPQTDIMRRWWDHMADLMETNSDGSPVVYPLEEMFYLD
jgi:L-rhamnose mutarotase